MPFWAYMLHCRGGTFYTGHTDDINRRMAEHQSGAIAGFSATRLPVELVWSQEFITRDEAKAAELRIKGWSREKKLALIRGDWSSISQIKESKISPSTSSGRAGVVVLARVIDAIHSHARKSAPEECCGILLGAGQTVTAVTQARNVHPTPQTHFEVDSQALIDAHRAARSGGPEVLGYYHSHPAGEAIPSATDRAMAHGDGLVWAIFGRGGVQFWRDGEEGFESLPYAVAAG